MGAKITIGTYAFEDRTLKSVSYNKTESLAIGALSVNTLTAVVVCDDPNILTLPQNEPVVYFKSGSQMGLAYKSSIKDLGVVDEGTIYQISAVSTVGLLTQMAHRGGMYKGVPASTIAADICGGLPYSMQANMQNILVYGWLPYVVPSGAAGTQKGSARDNLARLLFAIGGNLRTDVDGVLRIENLRQTASAEISAGRVSPFSASDTHDTPVTSLTVLEYQYIESAATAAEVLFEGTTTDGQIIYFDRPMFALTGSGITITESGANYAVVGAGNGTITGKPYTVATREITRSVTSSPVVNTIRITDSTLVGVTNSNDVVTRLVDYYRHRETVSCDIVMGFENPGDVVNLYNPMTRQNVTACLSEIGVVSSEVDKGRINALVGFTPWQTVEFEDVRVVLTGSGTWTPEEGVTSVTAVLIGGGSGGNKGGDGANGTRYTYSGTVSSSFSVRNGTGGEGGVGGQGGSGGNVLRVDMSIQSRAGIQYAVGAAGVGGETGTTGGATTFGAYTSADGSSSAVGYTDPVTGEVFAAAGADGLNGGKGGNGGSAGSGYANDGEAGGDVGIHVGGHGGGSRHESEADYQQWGTMFCVGGGGGGGASANADGTDGTIAASGSGSTITGGAGGNGGSATAPAAKTVCGAGGDGGAGGGGGGGTAGVYYRRKDTSQTMRAYYSPVAGAGGAGANGGDGAPGCIILTYRRPVTT